MENLVNRENEINGEIVLYQPDDNIRLEVRVDKETVWLSQAQMGQLFGTNRQAITKHVRNIYETDELNRDATSSILELVQKEGERTVRRRIEFYNLDVIISVGFRVNTRQGILFRQWANSVLKQHLLHGYSINRQIVALQQHMDDRLLKIEDRLDRQQEDIDFYIKTNQQPSEILIPTGCVWDAYSYLSKLVRTAKRRVILIDNFVDERTLMLLDKRAPCVVATVYTRYSDKVRLDFEKHNAQYGEIQNVQLPKAVHDRYMIIDNDVWLLGASVKDMGRGLTTIIQLHICPEDIINFAVGPQQ